MDSPEKLEKAASQTENLVRVKYFADPASRTHTRCNRRLRHRSRQDRGEDRPVEGRDHQVASRYEVKEADQVLNGGTAQRDIGREKWLRKSEQGDKWNRCLIEGMIVLSETGSRDEQTTPP